MKPDMLFTGLPQPTSDSHLFPNGGVGGILFHEDALVETHFGLPGCGQQACGVQRPLVPQTGSSVPPPSHYKSNIDHRSVNSVDLVVVRMICCDILGMCREQAHGDGVGGEGIVDDNHRAFPSHK